MSPTVEAMIVVAEQLSPAEQLELIGALSESLRLRYDQFAPSDTASPRIRETIPRSLRRTPPATDLDTLVADFWPEDETADDINAFVAQQRAEDRRRGT